MDINRPGNVFVSLVLVFLLTGVGIGVIKAENIDLFEQQKLISHLLVNAFLEKVDDEKLVIFDQEVRRDDLVSHHVAYVHQIGDDDFRAELCFRLTRLILVPGFEGFYAERILVEMARDGSIIEISTHVAPVEQEQAPEQKQGFDKFHTDR